MSMPMDPSSCGLRRLYKLANSRMIIRLHSATCGALGPRARTETNAFQPMASQTCGEPVALSRLCEVVMRRQC